jgi:hypothetical protein
MIVLVAAGFSAARILLLTAGVAREWPASWAWSQADGKIRRFDFSAGQPARRSI